MPHDILNPVMALLIAGGLFGLQALAIPLLNLGWDRMPQARRDKLSDVLTYLMGKPSDPVDTIALGLFCALALGFALSAIGATLPSIIMLLILLIGIPAFM